MIFIIALHTNESPAMYQVPFRPVDSGAIWRTILFHQISETSAIDNQRLSLFAECMAHQCSPENMIIWIFILMFIFELQNSQKPSFWMNFWMKKHTNILMSSPA